MENIEVQLKVLELTQIQNICNELMEIEDPKQNDSELEKLLKKEYTLDKEEIQSILSLVYKKQKGNSVSEKEIDELKTKLNAYCVTAELNQNDKDGNFVGYKKLKGRASNKKNSLNKQK